METVLSHVLRSGILFLLIGSLTFFSGWVFVRSVEAGKAPTFPLHMKRIEQGIVMLTWEVPNESEAITHYEIFRQEHGVFQSLGLTKNQSFVDVVQPGIVYHYSVQARTKKHGDQISQELEFRL